MWKNSPKSRSPIFIDIRFDLNEEMRHTVLVPDDGNVFPPSLTFSEHSRLGIAVSHRDRVTIKSISRLWVLKRWWRRGDRPALIREHKSRQKSQLIGTKGRRETCKVAVAGNHRVSKSIYGYENNRNYVGPRAIYHAVGLSDVYRLLHTTNYTHILLYIIWTKHNSSQVADS